MLTQTKMNADQKKPATPSRFAWLSIAAAVITIGLKFSAYILTGSVGLLSDALESFVNLGAALLALVMLTIAVKPADEEHTYGHSKAEYFSSGVEGGLILIAAIGIIVTATPRLINPRPLEQLGLGVIISTIAALVNLGVALYLLRVGKKYNAISLEANANHLLTDVWTTAGVLLAVFIVSLTGWLRLDPIIAIIVGANIVFAGIRLIRKSVLGLMDTALPVAEQDMINEILGDYSERGVEFHALRTRQSGMRSFVSFHVLVPGDWSVQQGHRLLDEIETDIRKALPYVAVFTHLEPLEDPTSWEDISLDRLEESPHVIEPSRGISSTSTSERPGDFGG